MSLSREQRIAALPEHVRAMLDARLAGRAELPDEDRIPTVSRQEPLPLSFAQQRLWFLHQYEPDGIEYNASVGLRLAGTLDRGALSHAVTGLVARHEALRTTFDTVDGIGVQRVAEPADVPVRLTDLSDVDDQAAELDRLARAEAARPFDLYTGPVVRFSLWRLSATEHVFVVSVHHVVTDGWSMGVLLRDFAALYGAAARGRTPKLPPLPVQPADVAVWQRERFTDDALADDLAYWRERLAGITPLELPTDRGRPAIRTTNGALHVTRVPAEVANGLTALCRERGATLFMLVVAATSALLSRWSGNHDIALGAISTGRARPELEHVVGDFTNTLVLRSAPQGAFDSYLAEVKQTVLGAFAHQDMPFDHLVDRLAPERDPSQTPLVQALIVLQNTGMALPDLPDLRVSEFRMPCLAAAFDITFDFAERDGGIDLSVEYNTDLFDLDTVERLAEGLTLLLQRVAVAPSETVEALPILTETDRARLLDWNDTTVPRPPDDPIQSLFEASVDRTPDAVAVRCGDTALTFRELDERANRLAHRLRECGVGPEILVGVFVERDVPAVVAILAVLKAGGAYLPLDPAFPADRLTFMLEDSAVPIVLTQQTVAELLPPANARVVLVDDDLSDQPSSRPDCHGISDNLAYAIYTSGSTGTPKGVLIEHRNLRYIAHAWDAYYGLSSSPPRFASVSSLSVDLFFADMLRSLFFGGTFVICPRDVVTDPPALLDLLESTGATALELVPSLLRTLVQEVRFRGTAFPPLDILSVGSEGWRAADCLDLLDVLDERTRVVNAYGGTEATVDSTVFEPSRDNLAGAAIVPVGRPLANTRVYVVDEQLRPVPVGVAGELCIAGDGLARGYLNRPDLTAERFVRVRSVPERRLYRTGDRCRRLADGTVEFLGRVDDQVKIRGFRVEPGEVEALLSTHESVRECVVVADATTGRNRLAAYVVGDEPDPTALRAFLGAELPAYMVPSAFVVLDRLPLTPAGTVDRRALPAPHAGAGTTGFVAPSTPVETQLATIWASVLGVENVGVLDNFFELGGDSILSIQMVAQARRAGLRLSSKDVFVRQTIRSLAVHVGSGPAPEAVTEQRTEPGPVVLTPVQRWFFDTYTVAPWHYTMSVLLDVADGIDHTALRDAFHAVVAHHDALELRYEHTAEGWRQAVPRERQRTATFETVAATTEEVDTIAREAQAGLDLANGPLVRAVLLRLDTGRTQLFLTIHHLVVDGVSWRILLSDLDAAYHRIVAGAEVDLGERTTSFQYWARRLAEYVRAGGFDDELPYWSRLDEFDPRLPVDAHGPNRAAAVDSVSVGLDADTTEALLTQAPSAYRTQVNDLLVSALAVVLARWTGRDRLLIGMEGHGREDLFDEIDLSRTVGWFTTHFPVPLTVAADGDPGVLIKSVKEQLRGVPRRGIGYDALRYLAEPTSPLADQAQPQLSFNYLGQWETGTAGALFEGRHVGVGADHSRDDHRQYLLDVACSVERGRLEFVWLYSTEIHRRSTIRRLAEEVVAALAELVDHCLLPGTGGATPSDFPLARLDQAAVERLADDEVEDLYPLTPTQAGMLFHSLMNSDSGVYVDQMSFVLDGADEPTRVGAAWQAVVDDTPILRSSFRWEGLPEPMQVVHRSARVPTVYFDWSGLPADEQEARARDYLDRERARGMALDEAPLLRLAVARISTTSVRVLRTSHHLLLDGWSTFHVLGDLVRHHDALRGASSATPPRRPPFRDYVAWLRDRDHTLAEAYWRDRLAGLDTTTPLPFDRPPAISHASEATASVTVPFPPGALRALADFAREHRVTVNTVTQGAWALLLSRYSGERDVCFGATVSGRPADLAGADDIVGMFINTVPVRVRIDPEHGLADWLRALQPEHAASREHEFVSLPDLAALSDLPGGSDLFDSIVVFENFPAETRTAADGGVRLDTVEGVESTSYPLNLLAYPGEDLAMMLTYDPGLFDAETVENLAEHLALLLDAFPRVAEGKLGDLPSATPRELRELARWNDTDHPVRPATLVNAFEAQVDRTPDATAVVAGDTALTYRELDAWANRFAHALLAEGLTADGTAAVLLPRGVEQVVALYAILKTGAAYLPVEVDLPDERIDFMLSDANPSVVVTDLPPRPTWPPAVRVVECREYAAERPKTPVADTAAAYVIYTSGSTGRPKGVVVPHRGIVNRLAWMQAEFGIGPDDRVLQKTPASFDVSVWEFFWPLQVGATLVVARPDGHRDPAYLASLIERESVTTVHFVPSMLRAFLAEPAIRRCSSLRRVICSGEALPAELWRRFREVLDAPLYNLYGPTEASVDVTYHRCAPGDVGATVPIGRPVWNTQVHVLGADLRPVPVGAKGELYLGGVQLARGYLNRPELTAERFVGTGPSRLYRTGDLARWRRDGTLEYLGRVDDQVKIRGFRVEPGEIEAVLTQHPDVSAAAVVTGGESDRLVAYLTPARADGVDVAAVRAALAARVPDHMVPASFVPLDELPLTTSGKLDRRALPEPVLSPVSSTAPRTPAERKLAGIWAENLGFDAVGADDDFFALGGDSIRSIGLAARIGDEFGVRVSPRDVFEAPTVARMAEVVTARSGSLPDAIPVSRLTGPLPLSFAQQRLWFLYNLAPDSPEYNVSSGLRLTGRLDVAALRVALTALVERHEVLRTTYLPSDGGGAQVVGEAAAPEFRVVAVAGEDQVRDHVRAEAARPFDLLGGPVLRALLLRVADDEHVLVLSMHHIATDGWSLGVLTRELTALYRGDTLPRPRLRYGDVAVWQRSGRGAEVLEDDLEFWRTELAGVRPLDLPTDRLRSPVKTHSGALCESSLPAGALAGLKGLCAGQGTTLFVALAAATQAVLWRWSGSSDVVLGTVTSGRDRPEVSDVVGFFVNTVVLRTRVDDTDSFTDLVAGVAETVSRTFAHQNVPFERLVDELDIPRDPSRTPLIEVMLVLQNAPVVPPELPGVTVTEYPVPSVATQFDLNVHCAERAGELDVLLEYNPDLFDRPSAEALLDQLITLLIRVSSRPDRPVAALTAPDPEPSTVAVPTGTSGTSAESVTELVRHWAARSPDAVALRHDDTVLTYAELDRRADVVADELAASGLRPGSVADVGLEPGIDQVVALLAVLRAGAAYRVVAGDGKVTVSGEEVPHGTACVVEGSVPVGHDALSRSLWGALVEFDVGPRDVWSYRHSAAADTSLWELWAPLAAGGGLVIGEPTDEVTILCLTATELRALTREGSRPPHRLRLLIGYGPVHEVPWDVRAVSVFSSARTAGGALRGDVRPGAARRVRLGTPLPGRTVRVLDERGGAVPVGAPGWLWVDGTEVGVRARRTPDGAVEDLGPATRLRGFDVDPAAVEAVLCDRADVSDASVVTVADRLVAYAVPAPGATGGGLTEHVTQRLPGYLVPSEVRLVEALPRARDGRVDTAALRTLAERAEPADSAVAPRTGLERELAEIFAAVLGVRGVGVHDNFFDLGGESIKVMQVVARIRATGRQVAARDVLLRQTVAALAALLDEQPAPTDAGLAGRSADVTGTVELTPVQHWFFESHPIDPDHFSMSVLLELASPVDEDALRTAVAALRRQHDALRTTFAWENGRWHQHGEPDTGELALDRVEAGGPDEIDKVARRTQESLRLSGPLFRPVLLVRDDAATHLLLVIHHLVVDAVSWDILLGDLERAYARASAGEPVELGPKSTPFRDWARHLRERADAGDWDDEIERWSTFAGTALPADLDGEHTGASAAEVSAELDAETTYTLLRRVPGRYRARVDDVLVAALAAVLAGWIGGRRVTIGMEGHGREDIADDLDLSRTVGWFTTIYPVELSLPATDAPAALVRAVKRQLRAVPQRGLGYGVLRYLAESVPDAAPQVLFNYLGEWVDDGESALVRRKIFDVGRDDSPDERRPFPLEVVGSVVEGRLRLSWIHSSSVHRAETVRRLAMDMIDVLRRIAHDGARDTEGKRE
ncbi:amino acid adenylation domain-containing protein [Saccharomonospora piscinae]|uniref:non-ribosomal peptide synthetase n=1 Tax=Saccharomonospora piscinae TaxID=687388 RepID=UPI0011061D1D|nr:non-ribosomal peptide synthetase [Saccharomonospora piscinae]TLW90608.1 amino acid adenylation domain-containing protein [Saccharomonospora piscinae]